ncbi:MAG: dihydroorotate dehydrogenase electron transfer subunit [Syntrophomonadaceae bacterium]|jgi:dihydroorotate dehydrogenase electron transfer subunit|nr:dihydroorotate dehydrogenase electron transfer subunit [Syntrophomonadaceae bacterium]
MSVSQMQGMVIENVQKNSGWYEMEISIPSFAPCARPGQFVHIKTGAGSDPLLRRPFSICDFDKDAGRLFLMYKLVGSGTKWLSSVASGSYIDIVGPLGKGFTCPDPGARVILVGGGIGIAPLLYLARRLTERNCRLRIFYGVEEYHQLSALNKFERLGVNIDVATHDGSAGFKGLVTDLFEQKIVSEKADVIYTCGPEIMMAKVAAVAAQYQIPGELSLEEYMACGVGACLGCARKLKAEDDNFVKICKDGPVFSFSQMKFDLN